MSAKFHKNGVINCTPIDGYDKVSILKNDIIVGENLVQNSLIKTTSSLYGFANRAVFIESGKQYTLSAKGCISEEAKNDGTTLKIYCYKPDWSYCPLILSISDIEETIVKGTFTATQTTTLNITSYSFLQQSAAGSPVTVEWYKFEEGSKATPWYPSPSDRFGNTPDTYKNPIYAKDFIEL